MISENPMVSVVVPVLNRAALVKPTIDSILQQAYPNIECIVVDGGSTDGTLEILKSYGNRIKWVSEPDDGHADAINKGWKMSRGSILAWLNADDYYAVPDAVRMAVDYFLKHSDVDVIYGDFSVVSEDGEVIYGNLKPREWDLVYAVKYCSHIIPQAASFMRRPVLEKVNWLDPEFRYGKDHELWLRIGLVGKIKYVPGLFACVRICPGISQHAVTCRCKVEINRKFFETKNLPPPFNSPGFRRRAMSNAYLSGGEFALWGGHPFIALAYFGRAFITDPLNLFHILFIAFSKGLRRILAVLLPVNWKKRLGRIAVIFGG